MQNAQKLHVSVLRVRVLKNIPAIISFIDLQFKVFVGTIRKNDIVSRIKREVIKLLLIFPTHVPHIRAVFMELQIVFTIYLGYIYKFIKREITLVEKQIANSPGAYRRRWARRSARLATYLYSSSVRFLSYCRGTRY